MTAPRDQLERARRGLMRVHVALLDELLDDSNPGAESLATALLTQARDQLT
ncbi:MAG: hypothetical protein ACREMW_11985 [Gemmatimonadales bacterium]